MIKYPQYNQSLKLESFRKLKKFRKCLDKSLSFEYIFPNSEFWNKQPCDTWWLPKKMKAKLHLKKMIEHFEEEASKAKTQTKDQS